MQIVIAIPCYNEEKTIGSIVMLARKYAFVAVIDDGSTDKSAEIARLAGAEVVSSPHNLGYGAAIQSCLSAGHKLQADILVTLDGDGQHNPDEVPLLTSALIEQKADVVIGSRFLGHQKSPLYRRIGQRVLDIGTTGKTSLDTQSGFRAYSSKALDILKPKEEGMAISSEIVMLAQKAGLKIVSVPIDVDYNGAKRSPISHGFEVAVRIISLISIGRPLQAIGIPSLALFGTGIYNGLDVMSTWSANHELPTGHALIAMMLTIAGFQGMFTSLVLWSFKEIVKKERR